MRTEVQRRDRERIAEITTATDVFYPPEVAVAIELVDDRLTKGKTSDYQFLFVDEGDATLGYAIYGFNSMTKSSWDLYWIAVDPECHGTGVGRLLLTEVESRSRAGGCTHLWVETAGRENYKRTRAFYVVDGLHDRRRVEGFLCSGRFEDRVRESVGVIRPIAGPGQMGSKPWQTCSSPTFTPSARSLSESLEDWKHTASLSGGTETFRGGSTFTREIERELQAAKAVLVLWSADSSNRTG